MNSITKARKNIEYRREKAIRKAEQARNELLKNENFSRLENMLGGLNFERAKREVYGVDFGDIDIEIAKLNKEKDTLMLALGYQTHDIEPNYYCKACNDTGIIKDKECVCLTNERKRLELLENPEIADTPTILEKIDFSIYGQQSNMFKSCAKYLKHNVVDKDGSISLFTFLGATGVGKTFIAKVSLRNCLENGDDVFFINAIKLNKLFLEYHLASLEKKRGILARLNNSDVVVIDDLGVEPILNNVTIPYFYELIIERLGKKTVITTNLSQRDLENRYGQRIFSRLMDKKNAAVINLVGRDLRI